MLQKLAEFDERQYIENSGIAISPSKVRQETVVAKKSQPL